MCGVRWWQGADVLRWRGRVVTWSKVADSDQFPDPVEILIPSCIATQKSVFTLFCVFLSVHIGFLANESQYGHYHDRYSPYPATNPLGGSTPKIQVLSHSPKITNHVHVLFQRDTHYMVKNTGQVIHDPYAAPYGQSPSPNYHETHAPTYYPHFPHAPSPPPPPPHPISSSTLLSRLARLAVLPTSTSLPNFFEQLNLYNRVSTV